MFFENVMAPDFDSLAMESSGEVDDAENVVNRTSQLLGVAYESFVKSLRAFSHCGAGT